MKSSRRRIAVFGAALLALTVLFGALPAFGAPSGTGSISGRVLDPNGAPVSDICVSVENGQNAVSDGTGAYAITGLDAGDYKVDFSDCRPTPEFVNQWYSGQHDPSQASVIKVNDAADTPIGDVNLALGVAISGTVTDDNGAPVVANVSITPVDSSKAASTKTQTDGAGQYRSEPVAPGDYRVQFMDANGVLASEYWDNAPSWNTANTLTVALSDGPVHGNVDAQLSVGATVEGTITDPDGNALSQMCADVQAPNNGGWDWVAGGVSDPSGHYTIGNVPPGDYRIYFRDCGDGLYIDQWFSGQTNVQDSTPVALAAGETRGNIDAQMVRGIRVSGTVKDSNGNPIAGIGVSVNPTGDGSSTSAQTDSDGNYTTGALRPGDYRVQFNDWSSDPVWAAQYWDGQLTQDAATTLTLTSGDAPVRQNVNATMTKAASISGTVSGPDGEPAPNICVNAVVETGNGGQDSVGGTGTAEDGTYTLKGLPATTVTVVFQSCKDSGAYVTQWWDHVENQDDAKPLTLESGAVVTGVNAKLANAGVITGRITDLEGNALENICAQATTSTFVGGMGHSDSDGRYAISVSKAGAYKVQFIDCNDTTKYAGEWWNDQPSAATAQVVNVAPGQQVGEVNAALSLGAAGTISGKVVNLNGAPMTSVCVIAFAPNDLVRIALVGEDGAYLIKDVPSGTYALAFLSCDKGDPQAVVQDPQSKATSYPGVWWTGVPISLKANSSPDPIAQGATLVTVKPGADLTGYDWCFGCTAITITSVTPGAPGGGSLTVAFTSQLIHSGDQAKVSAAAADPDPPFEYTVTCTSPTGVTGSAKGPSSPITVTGLTPGATYSCTVTASDGTITVGSSPTSAGVEATAVGGGGAPGTKTVAFPTELPNTGSVGASMARTGSDSAAMARIGAVLLAFGLALVMLTRSKRRAGRRGQASVV